MGQTLIAIKSLNNGLFVRNALGLKIIGFPIGINDPKYPRNRPDFQFMFRLFGIYENHSIRTNC